LSHNKIKAAPGNTHQCGANMRSVYHRCDPVNTCGNGAEFLMRNTVMQKWGLIS